MGEEEGAYCIVLSGAAVAAAAAAAQPPGPVLAAVGEVLGLPVQV